MMLVEFGNCSNKCFTHFTGGTPAKIRLLCECGFDHGGNSDRDFGYTSRDRNYWLLENGFYRFRDPGVGADVQGVSSGEKAVGGHPGGVNVRRRLDLLEI